MPKGLRSEKLLIDNIEKNIQPSLVISDSEVGMDEAKKLSEALQQNSSITSITLLKNNIEKGVIKEIFSSLNKNKKFANLDLSCNNISKEVAEELAEALSENYSIINLIFRRNKVENWEVLLEFIKTNKNIKNLKFIENNISTQGLGQLGEALKVNKTLKSLLIWHEHMDKIGSKALFKALSYNHCLKSLRIKPHENIKLNWSELGQSLKKGSGLTYLNLFGNIIEDAGAISLAIGLKYNNKLISLELGVSGIESEGARVLAEALKENNKLAYLNLEGNDLGDEGAKNLAEALKTNKSLAYFNISRIKVGNEGTTTLANALKQNNNLISLDVSSNNIDSEGIKDLTEAMEDNSRLTSLNLNGNEIGEEGVKAISTLLKSKSNLIKLNLGENCITNEGVKALAEALKINDTLEYLELGQDVEPDTIPELREGAVAIAEALKYNKTLIHLDLSRIDIGTEALKAIARALKAHGSLACLYLGIDLDEGSDEEPIENFEGLITLAKTLKYNKCLSYSDYMWNNLLFMILEKAEKENKVGSDSEEDEKTSDSEEDENLFVENFENNHDIAEDINSEFYNYLEAILNNKCLDTSNLPNISQLKARRGAIKYILQDEEYLKEANIETILFFEYVAKNLKNYSENFNSIKELFENSMKQFAIDIYNGRFTYPKDFPPSYIEQKLEKNESWQLSKEFTAKMLNIEPIPSLRESSEDYEGGKYNKAIEKLEKVTKELPSEVKEILDNIKESLAQTERSQNLIENYLELAKAYKNIDELQVQLELYDKILSYDSHCFEAHLGKSEVLRRFQDYEKAKQEIDVCMEINPNSSLVYMEKVEIQKSTSEKEQAIATLTYAHQFASLDEREKIMKEINHIKTQGEKEEIQPIIHSSTTNESCTMGEVNSFEDKAQSGELGLAGETQYDESQNE